MKKSSFKGTKIYTGIDVHARQWNVGIYSSSSAHKTFQQPAKAEVLVDYLTRNFPGGEYYTVYEAGFCGFTIHRALESAGIKNIVVNPADVPTKDNERKQKRDRVDARKLGRSLRNGDLRGIYIPTVKGEQDRELVRYRCNGIQPKLTRVKNQIKSLLRKYGHAVDIESSAWSKAYREYLEQIEFEEKSAKQTLQHLLEELDFHQSKLREINRQIVALSKEEAYQKEVKLLRTVPGVGLLVAMVLLTEIEDMTRFDSLDQLCHYVGLVPNVYASGDKEYTGKQTRRGNGLLRRMLLQSAWVAKNQDPALLLKYEQLTKRMSGNKAIVRIEKKLLSRIRHVWLSGEPYRKGYMEG